MYQLATDGTGKGMFPFVAMSASTNIIVYLKMMEMYKSQGNYNKIRLHEYVVCTASGILLIFQSVLVRLPTQLKNVSMKSIK